MNVCYKCQKKIEQPEYCTECGNSVPLFARACPGCGRATAWVRFCPKCGNDMIAQAREYDGLKIDVAPAPLTATAVAHATSAAIEGFEYIRHDDGTYTVTGVKDKTALRINVPTGVAAIGAEAFKGLGVFDITLPESLIVIERAAFEGCSRLRSINFPEGLYCIEDGAFRGCKGLRALKLPESLAVIGAEAFYDCSGIEKPSLSDSVEIGEKAFFGTKGAEKMPAAVKADPELQKRLLGKFNYEKCADGTYKITGLKLKDTTGTVEIPGNVSIIGDKAFSGCSNIISVIIPDSVKYIGAHAFNPCVSIVELNIPASVISIGDYAFCHCVRLANINVDKDNPVYTSVDGVLYSKDRKNLIACPGGRSGVFNVPHGVESIVTGAFAGCQLSNVEIHSGVRSVGSFAFSTCKEMKEIRCGVASKPSGWHKDWKMNCPGVVKWGVKS
ncbi:MAG: leucine-rich repeat protein [Clostridia bacterium]|nr:leucine-rich repeat protein [Clostridia bacterium]